MLVVSLPVSNCRSPSKSGKMAKMVRSTKIPKSVKMVKKAKTLSE